MNRLVLLTVLLAFAAPGGAAPFDLTGPALEVTVSRGGVTLPIAEVPNLSEGDRLWIKADLPPSQSSHYLLVASFLSGSTNPPPERWFVPCKTWTGKCAHEGLTVAIPEGAQQVLLFLAPATGGDLKTLIGAVRGRPGIFVRTSQDLNQAALDRSRLERYLSSIRALNPSDPSKLKAVAPILARSLAIKVDDKCLDKVPELQAPCLMQGQESLVLNDGHSTSIVEALTSGPGSDLAMEASYTPQLSYGFYSPYIASVLDIARLLDSFHVAQYQYIPALGSHRGDRLELTLNAAPSFHNPKSVLVAALPAVEPARLPPLHPVDPKEIYCAGRATLVLPVEGAPLVFSTDYAHDVTLRLSRTDGRVIDLPAKADAVQGGYVVDTSGLRSSELGNSVRASLQGRWGFDEYAGPSFLLMNAHAMSLELESADAASLIVGRQDTVHFRADGVSCIDGFMLQDPAGKELKAEWRAVKPNEVEVKLPLQDAQPGALTLMVSQSGIDRPQPIPIRAFSEAGRLEGFTIHAGDPQGALTGSRLDEVSRLVLDRVVFLPAGLTTINGTDELTMLAQDPQGTMGLIPGHPASAKVTLKDGRVLPVPALIEASRPQATLISKNVLPSPSGAGSNIRLVSSELPQDATLVFSVRIKSPAAFGSDETVEIATQDRSFTTALSFTNGGMTLENRHVAVVTFNPAKAFGAPAFGPLEFRVKSKGVGGDWLPLGTLVRIPVLKGIECPGARELACKLTGSDLYLVDSVSTEADFQHSVQVPDGFLASALPIPHPAEGAVYLRLRDDPANTNPAMLAVEQMADSPEALARSAVRQTAVAKDVGGNEDQAPPGKIPRQDADNLPATGGMPRSP